MSNRRNPDENLKALFEQQRTEDRKSMPAVDSMFSNRSKPGQPIRPWSRLAKVGMFAAAASLGGVAVAWGIWIGLPGATDSNLISEARGAVERDAMNPPIGRRSPQSSPRPSVEETGDSPASAEPTESDVARSSAAASPLPPPSPKENESAGTATPAATYAPAKPGTTVTDPAEEGLGASLTPAPKPMARPQAQQEWKRKITSEHSARDRSQLRSLGYVTGDAVPYTESVRVQATQPVVAMEKTSSGAKVSDEFVGDLPVPGRFYQNVITLAPGANDKDGDGRSLTHGSRARDFRAVVTGVANVDPLTGQFSTLVSPNSIEEMEVITGGASVKFGRAQGGFANIVQKQGEEISERVQVVASQPLLPPAEEAAPINYEDYAGLEESDYLNVADAPLSTFSIDVDTASYSNVRRMLQQGGSVPEDAIRIEEMINYFDYDYPAPRGAGPFSVNLELGVCPWNTEHLLAKIGLQAESVSRAETAGSNLVFLLDVSGSMDHPTKLPLLKEALQLLFAELGSQDRVAIAVYAGASGLVLDSTSGSDTEALMRSIQNLEAGGSTAGAAGIQLAYDVARKNFIAGGVNRVILATDGDFNVGVRSHTSLYKLIEKDAKKGIFLTTLGFGMGNYQDARLEQLADRGNGNYAYIDSIHEARKVLVDELEGTLYTVAKDVKIQVEFNPLQVRGYRLIGYENRALENADFADDRKDAGELGSGHSVTALYEIVPAGAPAPRVAGEALLYQKPGAPTPAAESGEWMNVKLRYKEPEGRKSRLLQRAIKGEPLQPGATSADFDHAASVAAFGMMLRGSKHAGQTDFPLIRELARRGASRDAYGYRGEFLSLVELAEARGLNRLAQQH